MRRPSTLKNKRYLAGPYLFWSISFVVIPLLVVFYYAMTNDEGSITFANLAQITSRGITTKEIDQNKYGPAR